MWSQLPGDLVGRIADHLPTATDLIRLRSVCSSWRSSLHLHLHLHRLRNNHRHHPTILPNDGISQSSWAFSLSSRTLFLLSPSPAVDAAATPWLVKFAHPHPSRLTLFNPFSRIPLPLPPNFPRVLDLTHIRVLELGREYVLHHVGLAGSVNPDAGSLYMEKVVLLPLDADSEFVLLTIHVSGKLAMFRTGNPRWGIIQDMPSPYDDVILYKGEFYAVDGTGRCVLVGVDMRLSLIAKSVFGGDKKYLVESLGELLLVDMYLSIDVDEDDEDGDDEEIAELAQHFDYIVAERTVRFRVYRLDRGSLRWVEVRDLRDRVLFLGDDCTFSASAGDLGMSTGNCIFFADNFFYPVLREDDGITKDREVGFYDMDTGSIGPLENYDGYSKLFWPPPDWITSGEFDVRNQ
ncbi:hypothetical protein MLD38_013636 [Melastoma candidum]|uniref:Uncharacterized protein n=1 Tax=Melastoma candidum TaxID=119954 RepID=A0ACB9RA71_9MYRT|nr:hypothetical protein MLD38_013636 [Melastoma candidum]